MLAFFVKMLMLIFQHFQLKALTLIASININNVSVNSIIVNGNFEPASVNVNVNVKTVSGNVNNASSNIYKCQLEC